MLIWKLPKNQIPPHLSSFRLSEGSLSSVHLSEGSSCLNTYATRIHSKTWAIFEPLYSSIDYDLTWLDWIIIGPQSSPEVQPEEEWVQSIIDNAEGVPIFMKSSLRYEPLRREPMCPGPGEAQP